MRALHWDQVCPGSEQRTHFLFTLSRAEGVSSVGAGGLLLLLPCLFCLLCHFHLLAYRYFYACLYLHDHLEQPHSKIEPGPRSCPSTREGASAAVELFFRSPLE